MPEKFIEKVKKFPFPLFHYDLTVIVTSSVQNSRSKLNDVLGYYEPDPHHGAMHCFCGGESYLILPIAADIGTIAHEVSHFVWRVMAWIGAEHNNEVMAYMQGHYTDHVAQFVYEATPVNRVPKNTKVLNPKPRKKRA